MTDTVHLNLIAERTQLAKHRVQNVLGLLSNGATIPFIARYRKEVTGIHG